MMDKRKIDGANDESSVDKRFVNLTQLYITCKKFRGLLLEELDIMTGSLAGKIWASLKF